MESLYTLGDRQITSPLDGVVITEGSNSSGQSVGYISVDGGLSATIHANFKYGGGGTSLIATVETYLGSTWLEVARFSFLLVSKQRIINISANTELLTAYDPVALSNDTGKSGIFGYRWRCVATSVGTYTNNTSLTVRMVQRA